LAEEKTAGRGEIRFLYVPCHRYEIGLTYFGDVLTGKMIHVTNERLAKEEDPKIMQATVMEELENYLPFDERYTDEDIEYGYEAIKQQNLHMKLMLEEEVERMLDDAGYIFSDDGKSYTHICIECDNQPCVWEANKQAMILHKETTDSQEAQPNRRRHTIYRQMALIINDGPSGRGIRVKLPGCVLHGCRELFPDPDAKYTGHREVE